MDIDARVDLGRQHGELLGRHVGGRPDEGARDGVVARDVVAEEPRDAEIDDARVPVAGDEHVRRLQVAVEDAAAMSVAHAVDDLEHAADDALRIAPDRPRPFDEAARALDALHHEVRKLAAVAARDARRVDARDRRMDEPRERRRLGAEAAQVARARARGAQDLDGDRTRRLQLLGGEDGADASAADHLAKPAAADEFARARFAEVGVVPIGGGGRFGGGVLGVGEFGEEFAHGGRFARGERREHRLARGALETDGLVEEVGEAADRDAGARAGFIVPRRVVPMPRRVVPMPRSVVPMPRSLSTLGFVHHLVSVSARRAVAITAHDPNRAPPPPSRKARAASVGLRKARDGIGRGCPL